VGRWAVQKKRTTMRKVLAELSLVVRRLLSTKNPSRHRRERRRTKTRLREKSRALETDMNPELVIRAAIELAHAQLKLGAVLTRALLGIQEQAASPPQTVSVEPDDPSIDRAAAAIQREMLRHKDVGSASLLRTNFPPDEIRRIAAATLQAATHSPKETIMGSTKGSGQTGAGEPHRSEEE
jgi:uncharacterized membrane protein YccC